MVNREVIGGVAAGVETKDEEKELAVWEERVVAWNFLSGFFLILLLYVFA